MPGDFPNHPIYSPDEKKLRKLAITLSSKYYIFESLAFIDALIEMRGHFGVNPEPYPFVFEAKLGGDKQDSIGEVEVKNLENVKAYFWRAFIAHDSSYPLNIAYERRSLSPSPDYQFQINSVSSNTRPIFFDQISNNSKPLMCANTYEEVDSFLMNTLRHDVHSPLIQCYEFWRELQQEHDAYLCNLCNFSLDDSRLYIPKKHGVPKEIKNIVCNYVGISFAATFFSGKSGGKQEIEDVLQTTQTSDCKCTIL